MARITLERITKRYKDKTALDGLSLDIADNEFFVLFGPAGAGKTTMLKIIAGIEFPQEGLVKIDGKIMNLVEPMYRNISMVFENYALYPHMNVYDNIASPMRSKLYRKDEAYIEEQVKRVTKMMHIGGLLDRKPSQLSNGQRQRVAIGRCLVRTPNVFLMDEPLAHLDAKLRHFMRGELKEMQNAFNSTTLYVTHDYMEAMSLADRIAVLNFGKIEQIGTSLEMYYTPCNEFVARIFGEPEINIFEGEVEESGGCLGIRALGQPELLPVEPDVADALRAGGCRRVHVGLRGYDIAFSFAEAPGWLRGSVYTNEPIGNKVIMVADVNGTLIYLAAPNDTKAEIDRAVFIKPDMRNSIIFDADTAEYIIRHNASERLRSRGAGTEARQPWPS
ncbi:MAG: ABC transporter ATP-binding protein [Synergistaceae bacterium]|jgi:multiple sugar transport system ATP-binding protein|nr:ABC transporter ATP-binding protein [Synergistaceae bacterium]